MFGDMILFIYFGGTDFSNGVNFAIGGSTATPGGSPFSLDVQLHQFLFFRTRSFELINKGWLWIMPRLCFSNFFSEQTYKI
jgi:hypothetical protein